MFRALIVRLGLIYCLSLFFFSCSQKDTGKGKYVVEIVALKPSEIEFVNVSYKDSLGDLRFRYYANSRMRELPFFTTDTIYAYGGLGVFATAKAKEDYNNSNRDLQNKGIKIQIFKFDNEGNRTEVASLRATGHNRVCTAEYDYGDRWRRVNSCVYSACININITDYEGLVLKNIKKRDEYEEVVFSLAKIK